MNKDEEFRKKFMEDLKKGEQYNINKNLIFSYNEINSSEGQE